MTKRNSATDALNSIKYIGRRVPLPGKPPFAAYDARRGLARDDVQQPSKVAKIADWLVNNLSMDELGELGAEVVKRRPPSLEASSVGAAPHSLRYLMSKQYWHELPPEAALWRWAYDGTLKTPDAGEWRSRYWVPFVRNKTQEAVEAKWAVTNRWIEQRG